MDPVSDRTSHPEDRARSLADERPALADRMVQSREEMSLGAALGVAARKFRTDVGPADHALLVGRELCGGVKAEPAGTRLGALPGVRRLPSRRPRRGA
jgi:type I restriction enzyme R subunit